MCPAKTSFILRWAPCEDSRYGTMADLGHVRKRGDNAFGIGIAFAYS